MRKKILAPSLIPIPKKTQPKVDVLNGLLNRLKDVGDVDVHQPTEEVELAKKIKDINIIAGPLRAEDLYRGSVLQDAKKLEMIQLFAIGYDFVDIPSCTKNRTIICNVSEVSSETVAQHLWALILDLSKNVTKADRAMRTGKWRDQEYMGVQLWGKTLGCIGLGAIGSRVAMKGRLAFGMKVLAYDPYTLPAQAQRYGAELVSLDRLLRESDVVSVNVPLTPETRHLIGENQLSLMKGTAFIASTSRHTIDDKALIERLREGGIAGAGLDAFDLEPVPLNSPLLKMDNVVLTPEIGARTTEAVEMLYESAVDNVIRYVKGERPNWMINPSSYELARSKD